MKDSLFKISRIRLFTAFFICWAVSFSAQATSAPPRVVLLLHGLSGSPSTWDSFMADMHGTAPKITKGVISGSAAPIANVYYYRVAFGAYDSTSGRVGLENIKATSSSSGDFSTYPKLGTEVRNAVEGILIRHPGAKVLLVGHSRGGLAGRALLQQNTASAAKSAVVGLLTLGTPHRGSNLGLIYPYLESHSRSNDRRTWATVDLMREVADFDVRLPSVSDLATGSPAVVQLNQGVGYLPKTSAKYRNCIYSGIDLGKMPEGINLFDTNPILAPLSGDARKYLLSGKSLSDLKGDGIVQETSQRFDNLPGLPFGMVTVTRISAGVLHTDESARTGDIKAGMKYLVAWW